MKIKIKDLKVNIDRDFESIKVNRRVKSDSGRQVTTSQTQPQSSAHQPIWIADSGNHTNQYQTCV